MHSVFSCEPSRASAAAIELIIQSVGKLLEANTIILLLEPASLSASRGWMGGTSFTEESFNTLIGADSRGSRIVLQLVRQVGK